MPDMSPQLATSLRPAPAQIPRQPRLSGCRRNASKSTGGAERPRQAGERGRRLLFAVLARMLKRSTPDDPPWATQGMPIEPAVRRATATQPPSIAHGNPA
jgi:hypothetical protein